MLQFRDAQPCACTTAKRARSSLLERQIANSAVAGGGKDKQLVLQANGHCSLENGQQHKQQLSGHFPEQEQHASAQLLGTLQSFLIVTTRFVQLLLCASLHNRHVKLHFLEPYPMYKK
jgi:hypothetical protein